MRFVTRVGVSGCFTALRQLSGSAAAFSATISLKISDRSVELDRHAAGLLCFLSSMSLFQFVKALHG